MKFTWDASKAASNRRKHGVSFEEAETVLVHASPAIFDDLTHSENEDRYIAIGFSDKERMLSVSFLYAPEVARVISARKATRDEQDLYAKLQAQQGQK